LFILSSSHSAGGLAKAAISTLALRGAFVGFCMIYPKGNAASEMFEGIMNYSGVSKFETFGSFKANHPKVHRFTFKEFDTR
jgi:hypothetical protein